MTPENTPKRKAKLTFCGGTGVVTGANFLLEIDSRKILIDCGLEQGSDVADASNREDFPYDPKTIDTLILTHAHADHIGRIPKLVKEGFKGVIYSTPATRDLSEVMLPDAVKIIENESRVKGILPLYEYADVSKTFTFWKTIPYYAHFDLGDGISVYLKDSGHVLGSAMIEITINGTKIVFTGDLGNSPALFLRDTDKVTDATYLLMESVYGDRNHESKEERRRKLKAVIQDTIKRKRTLIVPTFSLERTQDMLFEINDLLEHDEIKPIKVYMDSPLGSKVTAIYERYTSDFKQSAKDQIAKGDDLFNFPTLKFTPRRDDSERIDHFEAPKMIIAGSGMSNGGRIVQHEEFFLPDPNTTLLLPGYQAVGTLGRQIEEGAKEVVINSRPVKIRAEITSIFGYSSHKDSEHLVEFVADTAKTVKKVFVTMGEPKSGLFLVQRLRDYVGVNATFPRKGESVELEF